MRLMRTLLLTVCLLFSLAACATQQRPEAPVDDATPTESLAETLPIHGTWTWVQSEGGKTGQARTPETEAYTLTATFAADGRFRFDRQDSLMTAGTYTFASAKEETSLTYQFAERPSGPSIISWATTDSTITHTLTFPEPDRLVLDEGCCDRYRHTFTRTR